MTFQWTPAVKGLAILPNKESECRCLIFLNFNVDSQQSLFDDDRIRFKENMGTLISLTSTLLLREMRTK